MKRLLKGALTVVLTLVAVFLLLLAGVWVSKETEPVASRLSAARAEDGLYISWREHRIDDQDLAGGVPLRGADGLELADLDNDGHLDIVSVHEDSNHVRLAFGSGDPVRWELVTLSEGELVAGAEGPAIADINGDGWPDIMIACEGGKVVYFQSPGAQPHADIRNPDRWKSAAPDVLKDRGSWIRVFLADLNEDGRLEAVVTNKGVEMPGGAGSMKVPPTPVSWLDIPDNPLDADAWREHPLARYVVPVNARPVDLDGDGDLDVVAGSRGESRMILFENVGRSPLKFEEHPMLVENRSVPQKPSAPKKLSGMALAFADIDQDGRLDIVASETPWSVVWLEQPEDWGSPWTIHPIGSAFPDSPTALTLFDIDGDGRLDLLTGGYSRDPRDHDLPDAGMLHRGGGIVWFEQPDDPQAPWIGHAVSRRMRAMYDAFVPLDLNGDGLMDFVGTRGNSGEYDGVFWLEQIRSNEPRQVFVQARGQDSRQLPPPPGLVRLVSQWLLR